MNDYYVYVYIDPRNFEEFYYRKGKGSRKYAHLKDESGSEKSQRIKAIENAGLIPIIRVIARGLSEQDALLVEKTLLWKLGGQLTNKATGHYAENFRPHDTMHQYLSGFDYKHYLYFYNVGEGPHRNWDDYVKYGLISAGQGALYRQAIEGFNEGDVFAAYISGKGYVGIGRIIQKAKRVREVYIDETPLLEKELTCPNIKENSDDPENSEYVALVEWIKTVPREQAKWVSNKKLFSPQNVRALLENHPNTISFLEEQFDLNLNELVEAIAPEKSDPTP